MAKCKFCQNLQSVMVAINAIWLTITRGAIEIKPSTPWEGVIENRNFWFHMLPPPWDVLVLGDWKHFTGSMISQRGYNSWGSTNILLAKFSPKLHENEEFLSGVTLLAPHLPDPPLNMMNKKEMNCTMSLSFSHCYWVMVMVVIISAQNLYFGSFFACFRHIFPRTSDGTLFWGCMTPCAPPLPTWLQNPNQIEKVQGEARLKQQILHHMVRK